MGNFLGEGTYGSCYLFQNYKEPATCVKVMKAEPIELAWHYILAEVKQMVRAQCVPGVVRLAGVCLLPHPTIISVYAGKPLNDLLKAKMVDDDNMITIITQFVQITKKLTEVGLCHCDLKCDNIVVQYVGNQQLPRVTIIDLGLMRKFGQKLNLSPNKKQKIYAPELYEGQAVSPASQVYQVGWVMEAVLRYADSSCLGLIQLARACMSDIAKNRPSIEDVFRVCCQIYEACEQQKQAVKYDYDDIMDDFFPRTADYDSPVNAPVNNPKTQPPTPEEGNYTLDEVITMLKN